METTEAGRLDPARLPDTDTIPAPQGERDAREACLSCWGQGWHARDGEVAALRAELVQAEADRDRYYSAAFDTPEALSERLDTAAAEYWAEFLKYDGDVPL